MGVCVVTGGAGFLGSHLCRFLLDRGHEVTCIDNLDTGSLRNIEDIQDPRFHFKIQDLTEEVHIEGPIDFVYHMASPASPIDYLRLPLHTLKVGSYGTHHMLGVAKFKRARFLLASTSEVYGDPQIHPQSEDYWGHVNPIGPRGVYDEAKRYAEALTMAYHRQQGVDTSIARIFNSILADEQVLYDDGRELRRETAAELAARLQLRALTAAHRSHGPDASLTEATEYPLDDVTVPAFSPDMTIGAAHASTFIGHPPSGACFEVRTRYGRSIRVTGDHSIFTEGDDGRPVARPVSELEVGDRVAIAGRIEVPERDRTEIDVVAAWREMEGDPWELHVVAEGLGDLAWEAPLGLLDRMQVGVPDGASLRLSGTTDSVPARIPVTDALLRLLGRRVADEAAESPVSHSKLLLRIWEHLGFDGNRKRIPGWILGLPLSRLKWFLEGYREGDGVHSGEKFDEAIRHEWSTTSDELKDDLIVALARFGLVPAVGRYESRIRSRGEQTYPFWRLTLCRVDPWSPLEWDKGVTQQLNARRSGDLVWATVTSIEEVEPTEMVYDFSVPGLENFWAGTGVLAHNTYGPRMRPTDGRAIPTFLRQALQNKPLTVFGDGSQTRSFCYVDDLIRGIVSLAESDVHQPVNIGNPHEFTLLELAETVIKVTGADSEIVFEALPTDDPKVRQPDITRAKELLGWEPEVTLEDGLRRTIELAGREALIGGD